MVRPARQRAARVTVPTRGEDEAAVQAQGGTIGWILGNPGQPALVQPILIAAGNHRVGPVGSATLEQFGIRRPDRQIAGLMRLEAEIRRRLQVAGQSLVQPPISRHSSARTIMQSRETAL